MDLKKTDLQKELILLNQAIVVGGPGTGKTFCIMEKIDYLIKEIGVDPNNIIFLNPNYNVGQEISNQIKEKYGHEKIFITTPTHFAKELCGEGFWQNRLPDTKYFDDSLVERKIEKIIKLFHGFINHEHCKKIVESIKALRRKWKVTQSDCELVYEKCKDESILKTKGKIPFKINYPQFINIFKNYCNQISEKVKDNCAIISDAIFHLNDIKNHEIINKQFKFLFIDNFQDCDEIDFAFIVELCKLFKEKVWIAGDNFQRNKNCSWCNVNFFDKLHENFPEFKKINFRENYKNTITVVDACNKLCPENKLIAMSKEVGKIVYREFSDMDSESDFIADEVVKIESNSENEKLTMAVLCSRKIEVTKISKKLKKNLKDKKSVVVKEFNPGFQVSKTASMSIALLYFWSCDFGASCFSKMKYLFYSFWCLDESTQKIHKDDFTKLNNYWHEVEVNIDDLKAFPSELEIKKTKQIAGSEFYELLKKVKEIKVSSLQKKTVFQLIKDLWDAAQLKTFSKKYGDISFNKQREIYTIAFENFLSIKLNDQNRIAVNEACKNWLKQKVLKNLPIKNTEKVQTTIFCLTSKQNTAINFDYVFLVGLVESYIPNFYSIELSDSIGIRNCKQTFYKSIALAKKTLYLFFTKRPETKIAVRSRFLNEIIL